MAEVHEATNLLLLARCTFGSLDPRKERLLESAALKLRNELHEFKTACAKWMDANATECGSCLCGFLIRVRADAALDESIEALWP